MKKIASFSESVDVLVKAYMNDTLEHSNCCACAVGNLVAEANGIRLRKHSVDMFGQTCDWELDAAPVWQRMFNTDSDTNKQFRRAYLQYDAVKEIESTGYSIDELARIEFAFETCQKPSKDPAANDDQWMFNGLLAVVDVLADIHQVDLSTKESAVGRFSEIHAMKA